MNCVGAGCDRDAVARGMCFKHYRRVERYGDAERGYLSPEARFAAKFDRREPTQCWPWTDHLDRHGYGEFGVGYRMVRAHRFSYELVRGPIPAGLHLDHLCRNRACVNPDHLEAVTQAENNRRSVPYRRARVVA